MTPGIPTLLCLIILFILISTGWFPHLEADLRIRAKTLLFLLFLTILFTESPYLPIQAMFLVHPGFIALIGLFFGLIRQISTDSLLSTSTLLFLFGSILFFLHEIMHTHMAWEDGIFRGFILILLVVFPFRFTKSIAERGYLLLGSLFVLYIWVILFHYETLKPFVIGDEKYLDTVWICLTTLFLFHHVIGSFSEWIKRRKVV
jgi:uncharacterized membrane protein (UPF0136 family)